MMIPINDQSHKLNPSFHFHLQTQSLLRFLMMILKPWSLKDYQLKQVRKWSKQNNMTFMFIRLLQNTLTVKASETPITQKQINQKQAMSKNIKPNSQLN